MRRLPFGFAAVLVATGPAAAMGETVLLDLPAGSLGQQVIAIGRLGRTSIVVPDARLWSRRVPALRGRFRVAAALAAVASEAGADVERLGAAGWRLVPRRARVAAPARRRPPRSAASGTGDVSGGDQSDIVITASKRDTTRGDFAGQVVRIAGEDLELAGAGGTERLTSRLTGVTSTHLGAGRNKLFIRGIADSSFTGPTQATVGQYYGDLRLSYNAPDPDLRLADLAAVEILEGPQGTLYGAGSLGGLIRLVPNAPDLAVATGSVVVGAAATAHGRPGGDVQAVINLPLATDRLAVRLVANAAEEGGYIDKPLLGRDDVNRTRIAGGRVTARLDLGAGWSLETVGLGQRIRGADSQYADRSGPPLTRLAPLAEGFRSDFGQGQLVLSGELGAIHFRSTGGVTAHDLLERYDATAAGGPVRLFAQANRTRMQANETRAWRSSSDGSGWLAGFSYVHNRTRLTRLYGAPDALLPATGVVNAVSEGTLYGEASWRLLPGLLATGGLRVTRSVLSGKGVDVSAAAIQRQPAVVGRRAQTIALPAGSALIDLTERTRLFLRYQQGFRPGGLAIEGDYVRRFRHDRVATIEVGVRFGNPGSGPFDASLTAARASWRDIQADFIDGSGLPSTANIGDGRLWTLEAAIGARLAEGLRLEGAVSYNDGRIDEAAPALLEFASASDDPVAARAEISARLQQIPNIARATTRAGLSYRKRVGNEAVLKIDAWLRYVGSSRLGVGPILGQRQGSYVDDGVVGRLELGAFAISAGVTNIADARGNRFALGTPFATGRDQVTPLRPRTFRIGLGRAF